MELLETVPILDVDIELTYPDDTTETFTFEAPNANEPFVMSLRRINILPPYRDGNYTLQKGFEKYQFACSLRYDSHGMNLLKLLLAETIKLRVPPNFSHDTASNYQVFTVFLENEQALKNYLRGLVIVGNTGSLEEINFVPSGAVTLEFAGVTPFTEAEMRGDDPNPDDDNARPIEWNQTEQVSGVLYKLSLFKDSIAGFRTLGIANTGGTTVFAVPDDTDFDVICTSFYKRQGANAFSAGDSYLIEFALRLGGTRVFEQFETVEEGCGFNNILTGNFGGRWFSGNINSSPSNDNPNLIFDRLGNPTVSTLCYDEPYEAEFYIRFKDRGSGDITTDDTVDGVSNIELIEDYQG